MFTSAISTVVGIALAMPASMLQQQPMVILGSPIFAKSEEDVLKALKLAGDLKVGEEREAGTFLFVAKEGATFAIDLEGVGILHVRKITEYLNATLNQKDNRKKGGIEANQDFYDYFIPSAMFPFQNMPVQEVSANLNLRPSYDLELTNTDGEKLKLYGSTGPKADHKEEWLTVKENNKVSPKAEPPMRPSAITLSSFGKISRTNIATLQLDAIDELWKAYAAASESYNFVMGQLMSDVYQNNGISFEIERRDIGKSLNQLSPDRYGQINKMISPTGQKPDAWSNSKISNIHKNISVNGSIKLSDGTVQRFEFVLPSRL